MSNNQHITTRNGKEYLGGLELERVHNMDCLEGLNLLPSGEADCVITDPVWPNASVFPEIEPYSAFEKMIEALPSGVKRTAFHLGCNSNPDILSPAARVWPFFRVCVLKYIVPHYLGRLLYSFDVAYLYGTPPPPRKGNMVICGEFMQTRYESREESMPHPCPRRTAHVEFLVDIFSGPNEIIVDPFAGSGTTGLACRRLGRKFIGFEINKEYCDLANERLAAAARGQSLLVARSGQRTFDDL